MGHSPDQCNLLGAIVKGKGLSTAVDKFPKHSELSLFSQESVSSLDHGYEVM